MLSRLVVMCCMSLVGLVAVTSDSTFKTAQSAPAVGEDATLDPLARGIAGSKHDFSDGGRVPRDLCLPCHTPHISAAQAPLLVKRPAATTPTRAYGTPAGELNEASLVCLSCHDGTVARDVYAGTHAMSWSELSAAGLAPGQARLTNHPVGIRYPVGNPKYHSAEAVAAGERIHLPDGRIQCTTCHDPHNTQRHAGMLVISNDRSRLCLACHRL
jgi:predicted CXXCH cytochrome family protein